jgi:hypothetical protein
VLSNIGSLSPGRAPLVQQVASGDAKVSAKLFDQGDCRVSGAAFKVADIGAVDVHLEGKLLLRQSTLLPQTLEISRQSFPNIHVAR